jgi:catechol-2,3-dioxygenase
VIPAVRLNHAVLYVSDIERSVAFYVNVLGMEVIAEIPQARAAFLRAHGSSNHHDLGLFGLGAQAQRPPARSTGLYHLAWQVDTVDDLAAALPQLRAAGAYVGQSSHGATKSLYGADPDGNEFEIMWMVPRSAWADYANAAPIEPLDLAGEVALWSGRRTAGELVELPVLP